MYKRQDQIREESRAHAANTQGVEWSDTDGGAQAGSENVMVDTSTDVIDHGDRNQGGYGNDYAGDDAQTQQWAVPEEAKTQQLESERPEGGRHYGGGS